MKWVVLKFFEWVVICGLVLETLAWVQIHFTTNDMGSSCVTVKSGKCKLKLYMQSHACLVFRNKVKVVK